MVCVCNIIGLYFLSNTQKLSTKICAHVWSPRVQAVSLTLEVSEYGDSFIVKSKQARLKTNNSSPPATKSTIISLWLAFEQWRTILVFICHLSCDCNIKKHFNRLSCRDNSRCLLVIRNRVMEYISYDKPMLSNVFTELYFSLVGAISPSHLPVASDFHFYVLSIGQCCPKAAELTGPACWSSLKKVDRIDACGWTGSMLKRRVQSRCGCVCKVCISVSYSKVGADELWDSGSSFLMWIGPAADP